jgi:hypothetical protein
MSEMECPGNADQAIHMLACQLGGSSHAVFLADHQLIDKAPLDRLDLLEILTDLGIKLPCRLIVIGFSCKAYYCYLYGMFHA